MSGEITLLAAFLVGLLGSSHCLGMCGGIVSALTLGAQPRQRSFLSILPYLLSYNTGRLLSYAVAGALVGALGAGLAMTGELRAVARYVSAGFMIALGLYIAGWWPGLQQLEKWGGVLWRRIEPLSRRLLPVNRPGKAFVIGTLWGWLPCGMVYSVLAWSLTAGSAQQGALLMLAFGLGTLPMLLAVGAAAGMLSRFVRRRGVRQVAGLSLLLFGVVMLVAQPAGHGAHAPGAGQTQHSQH
jgi:hypothetical protein